MSIGIIEPFNSSSKQWPAYIRRALKHLASTCNFGKCLSCLTVEDNLRDQFVPSLANDAMRSRIFAEAKIQYKEAVELALALEAAERHAELRLSHCLSVVYKFLNYYIAKAKVPKLQEGKITIEIPELEQGTNEVKDKSPRVPRKLPQHSPWLNWN
ncbi:unnamed protein product [Pieris macdunnoughi]|uniref:Uncharacterized protein n=1 Tax=Pieris macdunnoughi TaxID=345717 RepID=A0A821WAL5_9NEOP|nr:unnamed protein product [Pieris macdunnoughi]